ncbi:Receptor-interacting serine/threonine-protein kinase 3 [Labeo rohita]|uniref:Receptor-interacting serine/threonine-protein kinase 3 n=1 Tax=Labeo rohita TaxID=84645 RepID=A0ABQ8MWN4_LABRO|nr:Receptor-interacting serine/threonine-protein kinase 3 [Labeo rohita]
MVSDLTNKALNITKLEKHGRIEEITNEEKETYIQHWKEQTKDQSRLQCYLKLNREYGLADYLVSARNITHRHLLTKYRLSDHQLAIERGRHKKTWLPKEERICNECRSGAVETEEHFLLHCDKYAFLRDSLYKGDEIRTKLKNPHTGKTFPNKAAIRHVLKPVCAIIAALNEQRISFEN